MYNEEVKGISADWSTFSIGFTGQTPLEKPTFLFSMAPTFSSGLRLHLKPAFLAGYLGSEGGTGKNPKPGNSGNEPVGLIDKIHTIRSSYLVWGYPFYTCPKFNIGQIETSCLEDDPFQFWGVAYFFGGYWLNLPPCNKCRVTLESPLTEAKNHLEGWMEEKPILEKSSLIL